MTFRGILRLALLAAIAVFALGCGSGADTNVPQVERQGAPHPPGAEPGPARPQ